MTVHWITSPKRTEKGTLACKVFFKKNTGERLHPVETSWGILPHLWIGRVFKDREASSGVHDFSSDDTFPVNALTEVAIVTSITIPPRIHSLYRLPDLCSEFCVSFKYEGKTYLIPCVEVVRALYGSSTILVHQLLTTGGLDDLILRNTVKNNLPYKLEFDFSDQVSFINNKVARDFVRLYFNTALQNGFKSVYANYQEYEKIRVKIPSLDSLKLSVKCTKFGNVRFCSICSFSEFPLPKKVHYGPEKLQKTRTSAENGVVDQDNSDEDAEIEPAGNPTHGGHARADRMRSVNHDSSQDDCIFERKTRQSHTSKTKVISSKNADFSYSADEHTGDGTSKPIVFLGEDTALPPAISFKSSEYPLLGDILKALSQNRIPCVGITSGEIPRGQLFCWVSGQGRRRYEAAVVVFNGKRYMILEIQQDGFSASMLIMPVYSDEPWAEQMIAQFCAYNGSWAKDGFDNSPHVLLKHAKTRNSYRWAELIMEKIRSFPCS